jgi:hypothetical protein
MGRGEERRGERTGFNSYYLLSTANIHTIVHEQEVASLMRYKSWLFSKVANHL